MTSNASHADRTRSVLMTRIQTCILLAVVTSEEVAASLIDRAIALSRRLNTNGAAQR